MRKIYASILNGSAFKSKSPKWILGLFVVLLGMMPGKTFATDFAGTWNSVVPSATCAGSTANWGRLTKRKL